MIGVLVFFLAVLIYFAAEHPKWHIFEYIFKHADQWVVYAIWAAFFALPVVVAFFFIRFIINLFHDFFPGGIFPKNSFRLYLRPHAIKEAWRIADIAIQDLDLPYDLKRKIRNWYFHGIAGILHVGLTPDLPHLRSLLDDFLDRLPVWPENSYLTVALTSYIQYDHEREDEDYARLYESMVPWAIPQDFKYEGMWCPCGPGSGKTNLLHCMVNANMQEVRLGQASVFLMDSKSYDKKGLLDTWRHVDFQFQWGIENVYIFEASDKLGINVFDLGDLDNIVNLFEYMLSDLIAFDLTGYQKLMLTNCLHVVKNSQRPSIPTLYDLLENGWQSYEYAIRKVRSHIQTFFIKPNPDPRSPKKLRSAFDNTQGNETRVQLLTRLNALLSIDKLYDTLVSETTEIDLPKLIDDASVIIVNAKISDLGAKGSEFWQRLWTMLLLEAGRKRESEIPVYCYFDEAHRGIARDTKIPEILSELRSANIAVTISHQGAWQIEDARVTAALQTMSAIILKETKQQGVFTATMRRADPLNLHVAHFKFNSLPRLSRTKAAAQKAKLREEFQNPDPRKLLQITHIKEEPDIVYPEPEIVYPQVAEPEPEPFKYASKPAVTDAEYEVIIPEPPPPLPKACHRLKGASTTIIYAEGI